MPEVRNIVRFHAPQYLDAHNSADPSADVSSLQRIFAAEFRLSDFLATGLSSRVFDVGPALREFKITSVSRKVRVNGKRFWVIVSYDRFAGDWAIFVDSRLGFLSGIPGLGFLSRTGSAEVQTLCEAIDEILRKDQGIKEITWQTFDEWKKGGSGAKSNDE